MGKKLKEKEAVGIALQYKETYYHKVILPYEIVKTQFLNSPNCHCEEDVWEIVFDVEGWDDMWFSIIISDKEKNVLHCSNAWNQCYYPHLEYTLKGKKLTSKEKRLLRKEKNNKQTRINQ